MHSLTNSRWFIRGFVVLLVLAIAGSSVLAACSNGSDDDGEGATPEGQATPEAPAGAPEGPTFSDGQSIGEARNAADEDAVVATVDGQPVYLADFLERKRSVEVNLDYMQRVAESGHPAAEGIQATIDLVNQAGVENVAFASLIRDLALFQRATDEGHVPSEQEIADQTAAVRAAFDEGQIGEVAKGYVDAVGQDQYWNEIYPEVARRGLAIEKMQAAFQQQHDPNDQEALAVAWNGIEQETVEGAEVTVEDQDAVSPATVEGAVGYLRAALELDNAQAATPTG